MATRATLKKLERLSDEDFVAIVEMQMRSRPKLSPVTGYVIHRLSSALNQILKEPSPAKGRRPRRAVAAKVAEDRQARGAATQKQARDAVLAHEMLDRAALVSRLRTSIATNRAATLLIKEQRAKGILIELRDRNRAVYPAFQINPAKGTLYPEVEEVNAILGAATDPWGAASWWLTPHGRLGAVPATLVGTRQSTKLAAAAQSIRDDSY